MYNILLTDDEQIVLDSLSFIIDKNFAGQVNVLKALSGTEALSIVSEKDIDIIFMDINMPGLNGLETISCIKKLKPETIIIILSAFDSFQYAQEAMNLGASKYITKPVNRNIVIQTIRSSMDYIDFNRGKASADIELHKKLDLVSPMVENDFIYSLIFNHENKFDIKSYREYFNITGNKFCLICLELPNVNSQNQYENYIKIRDCINEIKKCLVSSFMMNRLVVLFPLEKDDSFEGFKGIITKLYVNLKYQISAGIKIGVSQFFPSLDDSKFAYTEAVSCLAHCETTGEIVFAEDRKGFSKIAKIDEGQELKEQILFKLKNADLNGLESILEIYILNAFNTESDLNVVKNSFFELIVMAKDVVNKNVSGFESASFNNAFSVLSSENDRGMLKDYLTKTILEYAAAISDSKKQKGNPIVKKVYDYINENLSKDISLEQMADMVNVSSFYLSKLFREEKGCTFVNFLSDRRLEKARDLLKNSSMSIKEITREVGYNDQNYLSRLFKSKYGVTPSEYRTI